MAKPVKVWLPAFMRFISLIRITSKECPEPVPIVPYEGQKRFLRELVAGLNGDVHHFTVLKSRQLGISTILLALDIFWLYMHPGLQGALICDTAQNLEIMRGTITEMLESLPPRYRVPIRSHNRTGLVLANGSRLQYMSAGKNKNSGLGRSRALNYVHATECSSWGDQKGLDSLLHALAEQNPNRLYVFESTALGYNLFHDMWEEARSDARQRAIFIGWWSKDTQQIPRDDEDFERWWGEQPYLTEEEAKTAKVVETEYGWKITEEQWAWYRRKSFNAKDEHSLLEEQPSTEHEAFQATGNSFFSLKKITSDMDFLSHNQVAYTGYKYTLGKRFLQMRMEETKIPDEVDLKVWENPVEGAKYVLGVDPAYGRDEDKDRSTIEVWRCFADKMVQVAEYSTPMPETRHVAWVMAHLAGCYRDCMINLEITGPGGETLLELNNLKLQMQHDVGQRELVASLNPNWALDQARWYLYHRPDSMGPGYAYAWKTSFENKQRICYRMREFYDLDELIPRSMFLLDEMRTFVQDGGKLAASGSNKDDRVMATALACIAYAEWIKPGMIVLGQTYEVEMRKQMERERPQMAVIDWIVPNFLENQRRARESREHEDHMLRLLGDS